MLMGFLPFVSTFERTPLAQADKRCYIRCAKHFQIFSNFFEKYVDNAIL